MEAFALAHPTGFVIYLIVFFGTIWVCAICVFPLIIKNETAHRAQREYCTSVSLDCIHRSTSPKDCAILD